MQDFTTPMMRQYMEIKEKYTDCLLFFRMGDFYELFLEDATIGAKVLNIALTSRAKGRDGRIPMAGVPYHAVDSYLSKLVKAGYKVAICEQLSEPSSKGIVDRDVIRIVTPGTVLDEKALSQKEHNYIVGLAKKGSIIGLAIADISTGLFQIHEIEFISLLSDELTRIQPSECVLPENLYNNTDFLKELRKHTSVNISCVSDTVGKKKATEDFLVNQFGKQILLDPDINKIKVAQEAAAVLLRYLEYTQKNIVPHCKRIGLLSGEKDMALDRSTILNLELFSTLRETERQGTLIHFLDRTITAMGGRLMRTWIKRPLANILQITARHEAVEELLSQSLLREVLKKHLQEISDVERITSRLSLGIGNARDLITLKSSVENILFIKRNIKLANAILLQNISKQIDESLVKVVSLIQTNIKEEPPFDTKVGGMIKRSIHKELDQLHAVLDDNKTWLVSFEKQERDQTGISSLKVRFNKVFGFYIEISKANLEHAPTRYMRKQTLVNGERFITEELKKREEIILSGEFRIQELEYELFLSILKEILEYVPQIQLACQAVAQLDCLLSFAELANLNRYTRPHLREDGVIDIKGGRHPVVEMARGDDQFVPNDTLLDKSSQLLVITGPNMAGKSVYLRQVAVIILLNQIGSFVPAKHAELSICDRIFVRSGASDMISAGISTFMLEMVETAQILQHATSQSLVIMDEIGRGTSTYDGISIAWAVAEYLVKNTASQPKTLFATHYHELQDLETKYPNTIKNYHMAVEEENGEPVFLYTLVSGGASHSFGVAVAKLAGLPDEVLQTAWALLEVLEKRDANLPQSNPKKKYTQTKDETVTKFLQNVDINNLTPIEALNTLSKLKFLIK
ncbi:DNA mismatch repair protein MutS [soil metagenome]